MTVPESDGQFDRRQVLSRIAAGGLGAVGGIALLPSTPHSPDPVAKGDAEPTDPVERDEAETPYAIWQYRRDGEHFHPTAPINVVFPLERVGFADIIDVFREARWYPSPEEYARYAYNRVTEEYVLQQWTGAETYFGKVGRYHVRCWHMDGTASIQAHRDTAAAPKHGIASYVAGRAGVEELFERAGWTVADDQVALGNRQEPDHDGWASVIHGPGGA